MMHSLAITRFIPILFTLALGAHAATLFDNLGPSGAFLNNSVPVSDSVGLAELASRFYLGTAATISGVDLVLDGPATPNQVTISFYNGNLGSPGALQFSRVVSNWNFSFPVPPGSYFNPTFAASQVLQPGDYWLGLSSTNKAPNFTVNWFFNINYIDTNAFRSDVTGLWNTTHDRTFGMRVFGTAETPEPASLTLALLGLGAILMTYRRMRSHRDPKFAELAHVKLHVAFPLHVRPDDIRWEDRLYAPPVPIDWGGSGHYEAL